MNMATKFTAEQRESLKVQAWQMHLDGMSQLKIAVHLNVAQSTVHYWLEAARREQAGS